MVSNALCIDINKIDFMRGNKVYLDITLTDVKKNINRIKESILNVDNTKIKYKLVLIEKTELIKTSIELLKENNIRKYTIIEKINYVNTPLTLDDFNVRINYSMDEILIQKNNNRCLRGNMAISLNGDVKVCPAWDEVILNLSNEKIDKAFCNGKISKYWTLRKKISSCEKCSLKWACNDCMMLHRDLKEKNMEGKYICGKQ